ncbi:hypothetical protein A3C89_03825 [Candidatus Kaiserbacteria bacterium RIFCSPHIGHO2_02_FULL_50_50]|uniref:Uncharacterized protein n=1 Tax=Candidatus Kaiserbacteria bacterium RIFCSPHIGHO2_02_FULL_50_50 TaxID=1798492 RepID=A0A1F6DG11_9BACT|nr:MAG: hypothetical protein A3C89_03825 [Candidatus Kaiserbacteria bacterium RIFCSPHIGHO2_02_FULL_50_50]OGG88812.1 MAG: hypothetical protein A3G62_03905 [Candidatus Kaiserbacteria bacterium RIFCSPLOWO2_12_FULL_50_10]
MRNKYFFATILFVVSVAAAGSFVYQDSLHTLFVSGEAAVCPERIVFVSEKAAYDTVAEIGETDITIEYPSRGYFDFATTTVANGDGGRGSFTFLLQEEKEKCWVQSGIDISAKNSTTHAEHMEVTARAEGYQGAMNIDGREFAIVDYRKDGSPYGGMSFRTYIDGYALSLSVYTYNAPLENPEDFLRDLQAHVKVKE